ncbi:MAG TPA: hypothetical protein PLU72_09420 [Candidatus Ozemobacteraceae bacterium]|nr:hypothetical protein [Candidatus Ozemobacteraceae bacterium]
MKRIFVALVLAVLIAVPSHAQNWSGIKVNPTDQVMVSLLTMVLSDLDMCGRSLTTGISDTITAVGHLNNAQSALRRTPLDPAYSTLITEIGTRIGKIKFYVVMNDVPAAGMRINQLIGIIRGVLGAETGTGSGYGYGTGYGNQIGTPQPSRPSEIPVGTGGQIDSPSGVSGIGLPTTN